jgi:hypothetical protein
MKKPPFRQLVPLVREVLGNKKAAVVSGGFLIDG